MGPGVGLQRVLRLRWDPALVIPLGLLFAAFAYWLSLVAFVPWLFPLAVLAADVPLLRRGLAKERAEGPALRGALPALGVLVALLVATQYRANRQGADGSFLLDLGEHTDTAVHVGLSWELVAGYPPQVPGLAGVPMRYHVGSHLVRAAATRWAGIHPYDSISRFDVTLWGIALVLALRAAAQALGLGATAMRVAGFLPLGADLSYVPGAILGAQHWAMKLGGNLLEAVFYANTISPALAATLAALVAIARASRAEGRRFLVLASLLGAGATFLKAFTGAQLLLALGLAWLFRRSRPLVAVAVPVAAAVALLALGSLGPGGGESVGARVAFLPFAPANPARLAFGLPEARGLALAWSGVAWLLLSLGLRAAGIPGALRALRSGDGATATLGAFALAGWPIALFVSVTADPAYDEGFYFLQASGLALWLFAARALGDLARRSRAGVALLVLLALPSTAEFLARRALQEPDRISAPIARAMAALRAASCPGDVVLMRPSVAFVPPVVVLAGRRVPLATFIPYWRQFTTPAFMADREAAVASFFRAGDAESALEAARHLGARFAVFYRPPREHSPSETGPRPVRDALLEAGALAPVHVESGAAVFRLVPLAPEGRCPSTRGL
ncbi:MAG TPA: hypothetical protein VL691_15540 [Vicinamibacteria bacterium]|nr:hypothetical protein [Vicinamibacteria bacterium]